MARNISQNEKLAYTNTLLGNTILKFGEVAGPMLAVELRMRLIGEFSKVVQIKLKQIQEDLKKNI